MDASTSTSIHIINNIFASVLTGIYALGIFIFVSKTVSVKQRLAVIGVFNKWIVLAFLLFTFGFTKHSIGYFLTIESNYCKQTNVCADEVINNTHHTLIDKLKSLLGFMENVWLENIGDGIIFVFVGIPAFLFFENKYIASFFTGILAHLLSDYSGMHAYFCKTSCDSNILLSSLQ
jgi:hypothetical protein